jgi:hypothetical protein
MLQQYLEECEVAFCPDAAAFRGGVVSWVERASVYDAAGSAPDVTSAANELRVQSATAIAAPPLS